MFYFPTNIRILLLNSIYKEYLYLFYLHTMYLLTPILYEVYA